MYGPQSEDCLTINVFVPPRASASGGLHIMVYIYGGYFTTGSSRFAQYNGDALAQEGVIIVTFNYRVGPWGFFASDELLQVCAYERHFSNQTMQFPLN